MPTVHGTVGKDTLLVALEIGSIFLDSSLVTCNKNRKTVHTLWPGNSTLGNKPKERKNNWPGDAQHTTICMSEDVSALLRRWGVGFGDGGQEAFTGNRQFRIMLPCNHH